MVNRSNFFIALLICFVNLTAKAELLDKCDESIKDKLVKLQGQTQSVSKQTVEAIREFKKVAMDDYHKYKPKEGGEYYLSYGWADNFLGNANALEEWAVFFEDENQTTDEMFQKILDCL